MVNVRVLRSSSSGNATLIWNKEHAILIDCGIGPNVMKKLLGLEGFSIGDLSGVLVTHAHRDHSNASTIKRLFLHNVPVYCTPGVKKVLLRDHGKERKHQFRTFSKKAFTLESFRVTSFSVSHDSEGGCVGFCVFSGEGEQERKVSLVTDYGDSGDYIAQRILDSHLILIASNYCSIMMEQSTVVPKYIKQRHIVPYHPSNDECAGVLQGVAQSSAILPKVIYLLHISKNHNTIRKAVSKSLSMLRKAGYRDVSVLPTYRDAPSVATNLGEL